MLPLIPVVLHSLAEKKSLRLSKQENHLNLKDEYTAQYKFLTKISILSLSEHGSCVSITAAVVGNVFRTLGSHQMFQRSLLLFA
jgi:hypothetical protein